VMDAVEVVIVSGERTRIGSYIGALREVPAYRLAALVLDAAVRKAGVDPARVDEVVLGQSYQNGESVNVARMALLAAGWPVEITGITLDRRCCSGLDAVRYAQMTIASGNAEIVVAGGVDSMSRAEFYIPGDRIKWGLGGGKDDKWGFMPKGHGALSMWGLPFFDRIQRARVMSQPLERFGELNSMMSWAEAAAREEGVSRQAADAWAVGSHRKACAAIAAGKFAEEIVAVPVPGPKGQTIVIDGDEPPRPDTDAEKLARLKTVYPDGICTAGNSSTENDGAAALVLMSARKAGELGLTPLARLVSHAVAAADPTLTYPAVPAAVAKSLAKAKLTIADMELIEIQEAFAAQTLADAKLMGLTEQDCEQRVNVNGSGISLGHPIGATGAMRLVTLIHEMQRRKVRYGLETICGGGGQGIAAVFERCAQDG